MIHFKRIQWYPLYHCLFSLSGLNIDSADVSQMDDQTEMQQKFQEAFKTRTRDEWTEIFSKLDACVQPVLELDEAPQHPHNQGSKTFIQNPSNGKSEPAPAPRLSRTPGVTEVLPQPQLGQDTVAVLQEAGLEEEEIAQLLKEGVVMGSKKKAKLWFECLLTQIVWLLHQVWLTAKFLTSVVVILCC